MVRVRAWPAKSTEYTVTVADLESSPTNQNLQFSNVAVFTATELNLGE